LHFFLFSTIAFAGTSESFVSTSVTVNSGTKTHNITTNQNTAVKGRNQTVSDSYTNNQGRTTEVTGSSSYGIGVKAEDGSGTGLFGSYGNTKGYSEKYNSTTTNQKKSFTKEEMDKIWFQQNVWNTDLAKFINENIKELQESPATNGIYYSDNYFSDELPNNSNTISSVKKSDNFKGATISRHVSDYYVKWDFYNKTTGKSWSYKKYNSPMDKLTWKFDEVGSYTVTSIPWSKWDVGHYEYYTVTVKDSDGNAHVQTVSRWVHEYYKDDWYYAAKKTYNFTIGIYDLNKDVIFPITEEPTVVPVDELVK